MERAVVYSRVSTDAQERVGTSLDTQDRSCLEYTKERGWSVLESIRDAASGYTLDRPGIERLRILLRQGAVDVVVAYAVDRLSRNQNHIGVLFDEVEQAGARLEFVTEKFEDTAIGRFILAARAFIAEVEREKIAERTMRGKVERARSGRLPQGTGKGCYGYVYDPDTGKRQVNPLQAGVVSKMFERFCSGAGCSRIARELNDDGVPAFGGGRWHPLTIRRILQNEAYTGRTVYRRTRAKTTKNLNGARRVVVSQPDSEWIEIPEATPPLISVEVFRKAQAIFEDPLRRLRGRPSVNYRLRGHIRCLACGTPMVGQVHAGGRYRYYRCRRSYSGDFEGNCNSRYIAADVLERAVLSEIVDVLADPQRILREAQEFNRQGTDKGRVTDLHHQVSDVEERQRRLARLYLTGSLPEEILNAEGQKLNRRRVQLESECRALEESEVTQIDLGRLEATIPSVARRVRRWVMEGAAEDMELILRALEVQVAASHERVHIEGAIPSLRPEEDLVTIVQTSA